MKYTGIQELNKLLNLFYKTKDLDKTKTKKDVINFLLGKGFIKLEKRSIYVITNTDTYIVFTDIRRSISGNVTGLKNIINYNNNLFINCQLNEKDYNIKIINLSFIGKVSHSSTNLREDNIRGTIVQPNIKNYYTYEGKTIDNNKNNIDLLYAIHIKNIKDGNMKTILSNIIHKTNSITPNNIKESILDIDDIKDIIINHTQINKVIPLIMKFINEKYIIGKEQFILEAFDNIIGSKDRGTSVEEIIVGKDTKNNFEDLFIQYQDYNIYINIKTTNYSLSNDSSPTAFNINKLIDRYNENKGNFIFLFLFVDKTKEGGLEIKLVNFLSEELINIYRIDKSTWSSRNKNSKGTIQFMGLSHINGNNMIDVSKAYNFLKIIGE